MSKIILNFLEELAENNHKTWFEENRSRYESAKEELIQILAQVIAQLGEVDRTIAGNNPAKCLFRQYRDLRFSKNKTPYKTTMSGYIAWGGKNSDKAGYYLHIEPQNSFIGGGLWVPQPPILKAVRSEIYFNAEELRQILDNPDFFKTFGSLQGEKLVNPPKDFPSDFAERELLKHKSFIVSRPFALERLDSQQLTDFATETFITMTPFIKFLNRAIENME